jgi:hypothetical protein
VKFLWVEILGIKEPIPKKFEISSYCVLIMSFQKYNRTQCVAPYSVIVSILDA